MYQTILYMSNAFSDEAADEFADKMRFASTILTNTTVAEKATAASQVSEVQGAVGVMGDFALAGVMAYAGVDMGNLNWATRKLGEGAGRGRFAHDGGDMPRIGLQHRIDVHCFLLYTTKDAVGRLRR